MPALIDDNVVAGVLTPAAARSVIAGAFVDPPNAPPRLASEFNDAPDCGRTLLAMPAARAGGLATVKLVAVRRGPGMHLESHLLAYDRRGRLLAIVEAHTLTARRTAAASLLAAQTLGAGGARRLAVLGAGRQARAQIEAFADALPLEAITVWARRRDGAEALAAVVEPHARSVTVADSPAQAVADADLVTCATGSREPLVCARDIAAGAHVDLVGGFRPDMREADDALVAEARVVADTAAALDEAGDLAQPIARGRLKPDDVALLGDLLAAPPQGPRGGRTTLFKSVGHAAEDLVVAELLLQRLGILETESRPSAHPAARHHG